MAEVIRMPRMSDTMTEGVIVEWHKKAGDKVKPGDLLAEIETDKATMEFESFQEGTILYIGPGKGQSVPVEGILAVIGKEGEDYAGLLAGEEKAEVEAKAEVKVEAGPVLDLSKMDEVILMPRMSDTMTEGVIAAWHKKVGDMVKNGELLAEIETDKATMELESYKAGKLLYIGAQTGEKIPINALLAIIGDEAKVDVKAIVAAAAGGGKVEVKAEAKVEEVVSAAAVAPVETASLNGNGRLKASPLAKSLAKEKGIDLGQVKGSGDGGRIIKKDVDGFVPAAASAAPAAPAAQTAAPAAAPVIPAYTSGEEGYADTPNTQMRKTIARRLGESMYSAPHFFLTMELNMDNAMSARAAMNEVSPVKISFQDMLIKASAMALRKHPAVNSSWMGDFIRHWHHIHIGSAVAMPEGLIVPVIRFADQKSLSQIAAEARELYGKARDKKLQPQEFSGNTFTISNLGMMDIEEFTAIINPPDSCILAVGKIKEVVVRKGDGFGVTNVMKITLSCDHRSVDGAVGAAFLQTLKQLMENPVTMLV